MPNFRTRELKEIILPFEKNGIEFVWIAYNDNVNLIYTRIEEESFFLQIKKGENEFVIKVDKHTKPSKIAYLHKALYIFEQYFCEDVISEAFGIKDNTLAEKTPLIANDFEEVLEGLEGKIYIEIGSGSGRHSFYQAKNGPQILIFGIEIYNPAIMQVAELAHAQGIDDILLVQSDARLLLSVLRSDSIEEIFLHFPVPWDKKPHRRVVSKAFYKGCVRVLITQGVFELRMDNYEYFDFTFKEFLESSSPQLSIRRNENLEISNKYKDRWKRQGKDIYDLWVWDLDKEGKNVLSEEFDSSDIHLSKNDLMLLEKNFENLTLKKEDFFLHFENTYKQGESLLLKIAFGAFNKPEHCYLYAGEAISFVFKEPFKIQESLKAIRELKESVRFHFNMKHFLEN